MSFGRHSGLTFAGMLVTMGGQHVTSFERRCQELLVLKGGAKNAKLGRVFLDDFRKQG